MMSFVLHGCNGCGGELIFLAGADLPRRVSFAFSSSESSDGDTLQKKRNFKLKNKCLQCE